MEGHPLKVLIAGEADRPDQRISKISMPSPSIAAKLGLQ